MSTTSHSRCGYIAGDTTLAAGLNTFNSYTSFFKAIHPAFWSIDNDTLNLGKVPQVYANVDAIKKEAKQAGTMIWPMVAGPQSSDHGKKLRDLLNNDTSRNKHINDLIVNVLNDPTFKDSSGNNLIAGIELDYEHLQDNVDPSNLCQNASPSKQCPNVSGFHKFLVDLATQVHNENKQISVTVPAIPFRSPGSCYSSSPDCYAYHYPTLAGIVDAIHVMCYGFHPCAGHIGPEAPKAWVSDVLDNIDSTGQSQKFIYIMPNFGCSISDTIPPPTLSDAAQQCPSPTLSNHMLTCNCNQTDPTDPSKRLWDDEGIQPCCKGNVFFDNYKSLQERLQLAHGKHVGGASYYTVGNEIPGFFSMVSSIFN